MSAWMQVINSIALIFKYIANGAKAIQEKLEQKRREDEIQENEEFDSKVDNQIENNDIDDLNKDFDWDRPTVTPENPDVDVVLNDSSKKDEKEVENLNDEFGWTDITPER